MTSYTPAILNSLTWHQLADPQECHASSISASHQLLIQNGSRLLPPRKTPYSDSHVKTTTIFFFPFLTLQNIPQSFTLFSVLSPSVLGCFYDMSRRFCSMQIALLSWGRIFNSKFTDRKPNSWIDWWQDFGVEGPRPWPATGWCLRKLRLLALQVNHELPMTSSAQPWHENQPTLPYP